MLFTRLLNNAFTPDRKVVKGDGSNGYLKYLKKLTCLNWRKFHGGIEALKKHLPNTHIDTQINKQIGELSIGRKIVVANSWKQTLLTFRNYELMSDSSEYEVGKRKDLRY